MTREEYIAMLQTGRYYEGFMNDGGYAGMILFLTVPHIRKKNR
jgi:hypothetical protein